MTRNVLVLSAWAVTACGAAGGPAGPSGEDPRERLRTTWAAYVRSFIQEDGRVVDPRAGGLSTSEGQAYAMLRAVWMEDRPVFDKTFNWAVNNLNRGVRPDNLWAWKWGRAGDGSYRVLDSAFASDGDEDAALALIMAGRTWNDENYLRHARAMLADLWDQGTTVVQGRRYLLSGDSLCDRRTCRLNPSYYAPYAYRVFAREDPAHDWMSLVDTTYVLLNANSAMTATRLPSDWILLDTRSGELRLGDEGESQFSYDALRVPWRVGLDAIVYGEPRAQAYLRESLAWSAARFRQEQKLPAAISTGGGARAGHEALEMLAAMMVPLRESAPDVAASMDGRLQGTLSEGIWADRESYYLQNWAWFGTAVDRRQLTPFHRVK